MAVLLPPRPVLLCAAAALLALAGCDEGVVAPPEEPPAATVAALIAEDGGFATLDAALAQADLAGLLAGGGPFTVFAPTDEAFYLLGTRSAGVLLDGASDALLAEVLRAHVVRGRHTAEDLRALAAEGGALTSLDDVPLPVTVADGGALVVAGVRVEEADREANNGLVHAVDGVIASHLDLAERLAVLPYTDAFEEALDQTGLLPQLVGGGITVLAVLDDGFARQPGGAEALLGAEAGLRERVLRYHLTEGVRSLDDLLGAEEVVSDEGSRLVFSRDARGLPLVNDARILAADVATSNGVLHVIAGPLLEHLTIAERLDLIPQAGRVRAALASVGLSDLLDDPGPYTFFVPTDGAFTSLGNNVYNPLLGNQQADLLPRLLRHHLTEGVVPSDALVLGATFPSLDDGNTINVQLDSSGSLLVDGGELSAFLDLRASNGILHLMDGILLPDVDVVDRTFLAGYTRFLDLMAIAGLTETYRTDGPFTVVAPQVVSGFYFDPDNDCLADDTIFDHTAEGIVMSNPLGFAIEDLGGGLIVIDNGLASRTTSLGTKEALVTDLDLEATNGIVHGVNTWLSLFPDPPVQCN